MATELRNQEPTEVEHFDPVPAAQVTLQVPQVHTGESRLGREPDLEQMERHVVLSAYGSHRACSHIILWESQLSTVWKLVQILYPDGIIYLSNHPGHHPPISTLDCPATVLWCTHLIHGYHKRTDYRIPGLLGCFASQTGIWGIYLSTNYDYTTDWVKTEW